MASIIEGFELGLGGVFGVAFGFVGLYMLCALIGKSKIGGKNAPLS